MISPCSPRIAGEVPSLLIIQIASPPFFFLPAIKGCQIMTESGLFPIYSRMIPLDSSHRFQSGFMSILLLHQAFVVEASFFLVPCVVSQLHPRDISIFPNSASEITSCVAYPLCFPHTNLHFFR